MKILLCFGTRPEAIKMAPLYHELVNDPFFEVSVCVTAQHREMLDQVLDFFNITVDFDLNLMAPNQSLNQLSSKIFSKIDKVLDEVTPNMVLVHGDTTTSSIVAFASFNKGFRVGHVEAGLRTYNKYSPFPEELNRQITGKIADFHFAPTHWSKQNLLNENVPENTIVETGNTVIDALYLGIDQIKNGYENEEIRSLKKIISKKHKIILITGHRRENFGEGFETLCNAIKTISEEPNVQIIYPVHLNPNVQEPVNRILANKSNIHLINPLSYPSFLFLMNNAYCILTDSGGVQEEAPSLGKPVLVLRDTTERPEAVDAGTVKLVGTDFNKITEETLKLLNDSKVYEKMSEAHNPYGSGNASEKIVEFLKKNI